MAAPRSLFIASIGNPGSLRSTRHSAGHILLDAITPLLKPFLPPSTIYKTWQSPTQMNISGKKLVREFESFRKTSSPPAPSSPASTLVILHDELEKPLGKVVVRRGGPEAFSLKGHNGLKDIFKVLGKNKMWPAPTGDIALSVLRIGIGIGRPESRSPEDVSKYVLGNMEGREIEAVKRAAPFAVDALVKEVDWFGGQ
ncbi:peptidyl-tRNA hydrolase [Aspergillus stella-maris]|uniref:peptidyl-tRNA hydrolase n=1 Tax=Aspergillus stella-maris TaxID=1810926 RepID=UPI003CCCBA8B